MNKLVANISWLLIGRIIQMILSFIVFIFTVRYLGPANYGTITYVNSYVAFFLNASTLGLDAVVINQLVKKQAGDGEIITSATLLRLIASLIAYILLLFTVANTDAGNREMLIITVIDGLQMIFYSFFTINLWFQYHLESKITAIADVAALAVTSILKVYLLLTKQNIYWFASTVSIQYFLEACILVPIFLARCKNKITATKKTMALLLKGCLPFFISTLMLSLYSQIDRIMIKQILNSTEMVGLYAASLNICTLITIVTDSICVSTRPLLMELKKGDSLKYQQRISQVLSVVIWISMIYSIVVAVFSKTVIQLLYGQAYYGAEASLKVVIWYTMFANIMNIRDLWLIDAKKSRYVTLFAVIGSVVDIIINLLLIPRLGIVGAAVATLITHVSVDFLLPIIFPPTREFGFLFVRGLLLKDVSRNDLRKLKSLRKSS